MSIALSQIVRSALPAPADEDDEEEAFAAGAKLSKGSQAVEELELCRSRAGLYYYTTLPTVRYTTTTILYYSML